MHAGLVLADEEIPCSNLPGAVQYLSIRINDVVAGAVAEPWTLGGPLAALRWLAGRLSPFGLRMMQGQVILTGSPMRLFPVTPNCRIVVEAQPRGTSRAEIGP
jgi:2-keto-4-pentenoate hydratase